MSSKVLFKYKNKTKEIEYNQYMALKWIFKRFAHELNLDIDTLSFKNNNKEIKGDLSFKNQISGKKEQKTIIKIEVHDNNKHMTKIKYNNKNEIKINKEPINIKKFDTNLSNNQIINKKDKI